MPFPVIEAMICTVRPKTYEITGYLMQAAVGKRFNQHDLEIIKTVLRRQFPGAMSWRLFIQSEKDRDILGVSAGPSGSIESGDSFAVYHLLCKTVRPRVLYSAILMLRSLREAPKEFDAEALILGHPSEEVLGELELRIRALSSVRRVERRKGDPRQFAITIKGDAQDAFGILPFLNQLRANAGVASLVMMDPAL